MKRMLVSSILVIIGAVFLGGTMYGIAQEPYQHTIALGFDWTAGHHAETTYPSTTVADNRIILEVRDAQGNVIEEQSKSVGDCQPVYDEADIPTGDCGTRQVFTVTLPHRGHWELWAQGQWILSNGIVLTYTTPVSGSLGSDARGFALVEILEWYDLCPSDPPTPTLLPTLTPIPIQPAYTAAPSPTCRPTATSPLPQKTYVPEDTPTPYPTHTPWPTQPSF